MDEKAGFSTRLKAAMHNVGIPPRGVALEGAFNQRWHGTPVTPQAAWNWLRGHSVPRDDKLAVLADLLGVDPHWLRYGSPRHGLREAEPPWRASAEGAAREVVDAFLQLPEPQREVVRHVVLAFAKAYASGSP